MGVHSGRRSDMAKHGFFLFDLCRTDLKFLKEITTTTKHKGSMMTITPVEFAHLFIIS